MRVHGMIPYYDEFANNPTWNHVGQETHKVLGTVEAQHPVHRDLSCSEESGCQ